MSLVTQMPIQLSFASKICSCIKISRIQDACGQCYDGCLTMTGTKMLVGSAMMDV